MIDTQEVGAGSYPSAPENDDYKCYRFVVTTTVEIESYVYAKDYEEALDKINDNVDWEEIEDSNIISVDDIIKVEEVKE